MPSLEMSYQFQLVAVYRWAVYSRVSRVSSCSNSTAVYSSVLASTRPLCSHYVSRWLHCRIQVLTLTTWHHITA